MTDNVTQIQLLPQLMTQMSQLMQQMNLMQQQINTQANTTSITTHLSSSSTRQHRPRTKTSNYFWSHGACSHATQQYRSKKSGHRNDVTVTSKLGGTTVYCNISATSAMGPVVIPQLIK